MAARLLPALLCAALLAAAVACSGGDAADDGALGDDSADEPSPVLQGPASRYAPDVEDLAGNLSVFPPETYPVSRDIFAFQGPFGNPDEALEFLGEQGYVDGYRVQFNPDGLLAGVVGQGQYYVTVETYLFAGADGARNVYNQFEDRYSDVEGSERRDPERLGNRSSGWEFVQGPIGDTDVVAVYHRFAFQRGNLIGVVQTFGAEEHMSIDLARDIALLIDNRAVGETPAEEPTPAGPDPERTQGG